MNVIEEFMLYDNNKKTTMHVIALGIVEKCKNFDEDRFLKMI
jgi:hypothetical protein